LTDVGPENGPHKFIAGSHRTGGIPGELLKKGYARLTDEEVAPHYRPADFIEFTAPRGTIIAEDTRGLHKGQHVNSGHRLMLQIQFSNSLFGPPYPKISFGLVQAPCSIVRDKALVSVEVDQTYARTIKRRFIQRRDRCDLFAG
jgi:hypothetical protein